MDLVVYTFWAKKQLFSANQSDLLFSSTLIFGSIYCFIWPSQLINTKNVKSNQAKRLNPAGWDLIKANSTYSRIRL